MSTTVQTQVSFEAAHRLYNVNTYSEECRANLHGHSYKLVIDVSRSSVNEAGMIIDFKLLKKIVKETVEDQYDHSCILLNTDPLAEPIRQNCKKVHVVDENPTAEWMAKKFFWDLDTALKAEDPKLSVVCVSVQETENNIAIYRRNI